MLYSDYNMMLMGEIVYRISGERLDHFLAKNVFGPLRMEDTSYNPSEKLLDRIPPTEQDDFFCHKLVHGFVHDKNAFVMGGVSSHAGLFSSARDLAKFAQMYLDGGTYGGKRIISEETIDLLCSASFLPRALRERLAGTRLLRVRLRAIWPRHGRSSIQDLLVLRSTLIRTATHLSF